MTDSNNLKLGVTNFGPIASAEIDLRPLTVFVGPSNTGKSYLAILIYALHRFFNGQAVAPGFGRPTYSRAIGSIFTNYKRVRGEGTTLSTDDLAALFDWVSKIPYPDEAEEFHQTLPDALGTLIRPLLGDVSNFNHFLSYEIARCFGIEETERLIRHRTSNGASIDLSHDISSNPDTPEAFEYSFKLKHGKAEFTALVPKTTPLQIGWKGLGPAHQLSGLSLFLDRLDRLIDDDEDQNQYLIKGSLNALLDIVCSNLVSPLSKPAYYLPADRTGVMHAHRVVVGSLISRAPQAGLGHVASEPVLSGVLADFLEELVGLRGAPRRRHSSNNKLPDRLEKEMLHGSIRSEHSDIGYPEFLYQPYGWKEKIPLMNSSSMISELAPVVLYLRHIVQPGDVLIIEEPESHLHPAMQIEFIRQLAGVVRSGIRVMLTTHSEWVLEELAYLIRLSELPKSGRVGIDSGDFALKPHEVGLWRFDSKKRPNGTVVKEIQLDPEIGNFESGYDDVAISVHNKWAEVSNLIEERRVQ